MELITAKQAAKLLGITDSWAQELARKAHKEKKPWPQKVGHYWMAPVEEWKVILNPPDIKIRKKRGEVP